MFHMEITRTAANSIECVFCKGTGRADAADIRSGACVCCYGYGRVLKIQPADCQ